MQLLKGADLVEVPWRNGGGITRNIAEGRTASGAAWRLSRADVADDGPFSNFAGLRRILTVVSGAGMDLVHPGGTLRAALFEPVAFDGGLPVTARLLEGPLTDLNLMFDPAYCDGAVRLRRGAATLDAGPPLAGLLVIHVLQGRPRIAGNALSVADTAFLSEPADMVMAEGDALLEISLRYLDRSAAITLCVAAR
ncbi:HutD family protein [Roseovarius sp. S4756]|uniref:HutD/Ves family protein n=1 Tax=Roseovarius maritimus TaxID=3342637 RepID=UPI003727268E